MSTVSFIIAVYIVTSVIFTLMSKFEKDEYGEPEQTTWVQALLFGFLAVPFVIFLFLCYTCAVLLGICVLAGVVIGIAMLIQLVA